MLREHRRIQNQDVLPLPVEAVRATRPQNEKDHRRDRWSQKLKGFSLAIALPYDASSLHADWLAAAGLMLALHWPSGPWPLDAGLWTLVPSDAGCQWRWLLSALVIFGSGRCEKPARSTVDNPTADR